VSSSGLFRSLDELFPIPPEDRLVDVGRGEARQLLGCDDDTLSQLVHKGLPGIGEPGEERFDSRDLFNVGLHSGSGKSVAEQTFAFALRWMRSSTEDLLSPRTSSFEHRIECAAPGGCGVRPHSVLALPLTKEYDGDVDELAVEPAGADLDPTTVSISDSALGVSTTIATRGELAPLRSPRLREIMREFLDARVRWVRLPKRLLTDIDLLRTRGVASCDAASLHLAQLCREAGNPATTRIGWIVGVLDMVHAWIEVVDDDGVTKVIDPVLGLFAATIPNANPVFRDPNVGLRTNRLVPTGLPVGQVVAHHSCSGQIAPARITTKIFPAAETKRS
jgi:hypothetical protein